MYIKTFEDLLLDILQNGTDKEDRTGVGSRSVYGRMLRFDLSESFPLITTRNIPLRIAFEETMFFLRGETDTKKLEERNVNIWKGNTTREFLDNRGLYNLPEGDMGKGYGYQWRKFGQTTHTKNIAGPSGEEITTRIAVSGVDQVKIVLEGLLNDPYSRRHLVTAWNPQQMEEMALPPCHVMHHYQVMDGRLNSTFVMRSNDVYLGLPHNIAGYALLNMIFAKIVGLEPGELNYVGMDVHLYSNQLHNAKLQAARVPRQYPTLKINKALSIDNFETLEFDDLQLDGYNPHPPLPKVEMAI
jgi:thymidylate synthase